MSDNDENLPDPKTVLGIFFFDGKVIITRASDGQLITCREWRDNAGQVAQIWMSELP